MEEEQPLLAELRTSSGKCVRSPICPDGQIKEAGGLYPTGEDALPPPLGGGLLLDKEAPGSTDAAETADKKPTEEGTKAGNGHSTGKKDRVRHRKKSRRAQASDAEGKEKPGKWFGGVVKDVVVSGGIVASLLLVLYLYSGVWPPMVVIESESMMHGNDSQIGVIDTGDLTLVKSVDDRNEIVTYIQASNPKDPNHGFRTYGDYGNVIIYRKNGISDTPVIHRAIAWIEYNASASDPQQGIYKGDLPDIGVYDRLDYTVPNLSCYNPQFRPGQHFTIHFSTIFRDPAARHAGFVTHGDHNIPLVDQESLTVNGVLVQPVKQDWVVGKAEGELPWFGLFKLWITGHPTQTFPKTSVQDLIITIIILVVVPILTDYFISKWKRNKTSRKAAREKVRTPKFR